ncbi:hypothetical protein CLU79DRAFT_704572 [Phycomyces nitens]|nr:hypothetical protein CLU79DRAFT_704572 [Phycomyces nitens]
MENVLLWDEIKVNKWMASIGYSVYEKNFREQGITGDVLVNLDHESLKDLSVHSLGQRIDMLKNIYHLKSHYRIPANEWDYVPPSVLYENDWLGQNGLADYRKIEAAFQERDAHIKRLAEDIYRLNSDMYRLKDDMTHVWRAGREKKTKQTPSVTINDGGAIKVYGEKISNNSSKVEMESSKNVRLLLDDPCSKVITSALKKYNVADDWQQYALWIQYGPHDNLQERALGYDERPLRISQKYKEAKQNPVFVLKHVKDNKVFFPTAEMTNKPETITNSYPSRQPHHIASSFKRTGDNPKTAITTGRVGYEMVVPVMSSSISTPTPSSIPGSIGSSMTLTPSISKRGGTINPKSTDSLLSELGLDSGVASAIYSIMMEDDKNM